MHQHALQRRRVEPVGGVELDSPAEQRLIARIRASDERAFDELMRAYYRPLRSYARGLVGSEATAEELVQDLFLSIWRLRADWHIHSTLSSYLFSSATKAAARYHRRAHLFARWARDVAERDEAPVMGTTGEPADRDVEARELSTAIRRAIDQLPLRRRQVATLRFQHGFSHVEIARIMGVTAKAVERQASKALRTLRVTLAPYLDR